MCELHESDLAAFSELPDLSAISRRRMYYLLQVGQLIRDEKVSAHQAEQIGWTKLEIVARHLSKCDEAGTTVEDALALASVTKARDLPTILLGKKVVPTRGVVFHLSLGARAELNEALLAFGAKYRKKGKGLVKRETALIHIIRRAMADKL